MAQELIYGKQFNDIIIKKSGTTIAEIKRIFVQNLSIRFIILCCVFFFLFNTTAPLRDQSKICQHKIRISVPEVQFYHCFENVHKIHRSLSP